MAARPETGWQSEKTAAECMRCMLDNGIATDVCFEVGPPDGATIKIKAHKLILISRSAVFEAMFSSGMTECRSGPQAIIRVEDIDASIFKNLLMYIYCETVLVNMETAAPLMYAATKYMLQNLVKECRKCLLEGLNVNNVIYVLEQSFLFNDVELRDKCLALVGPNAYSILTGKEILSASQQIMDTILQMDTLLVKEIIIYETCLCWAKHQLQIQKSTEDPTDQQIRETLGALLYKIRFPIMDQAEFAEISEFKNILTAEEKLSIYYFLTAKKKSSQLLFQIEQRFGAEIWIERTISSPSGTWYSTPAKDAINFTTNQDIVLTGVDLYVGYNKEEYDVNFEILQSTNSLFKKAITVSPTGTAGNLYHFKVSLDKPIFIKAGILYSVKAFSQYSISNVNNYNSQSVFTRGKTKFTFSRCQESIHSSYEKIGQFPIFYFCDY